MRWDPVGQVNDIFVFTLKFCGLPAARWQSRGWKKPHKWVGVAMALVGGVEGGASSSCLYGGGSDGSYMLQWSGVGVLMHKRKGDRSGGPGMRWWW